MEIFGGVCVNNAGDAVFRIQSEEVTHLGTIVIANDKIESTGPRAKISPFGGEFTGVIANGFDQSEQRLFGPSVPILSVEVLALFGIDVLQDGDGNDILQLRDCAVFTWSEPLGRVESAVRVDDVALRWDYAKQLLAVEELGKRRS